jgi:DNA-binding NtrC family response regulator
MDDVMAVAHSVARAERRRPVDFSPPATTGFSWPVNVRQLRRVVRDAAARADVIGPAPGAGSVRRRTPDAEPLEPLERDEIVRCLTEPDTTMARVAEDLGIGRATQYRTIEQCGIPLPGGCAADRSDGRVLAVNCPVPGPRRHRRPGSYPVRPGSPAAAAPVKARCSG